MSLISDFVTKPIKLYRAWISNINPNTEYLNPQVVGSALLGTAVFVLSLVAFLVALIVIFK